MSSLSNHPDVRRVKTELADYYEIKHQSGLTLLLAPMEGYHSTYALFGTNFGSADSCFGLEGEAPARVPEGIAHFLEHKMFECKAGDAFARFAGTGASANAYTSFDKTCYLFSCSENVEQSLEILLDFVTEPYFTPETVQKEQGIIGQEIRMYEDDPGWRVFFNLLGALFVNDPVKEDIAGTVESIAQIDADLLYRCYNGFYNLRNMVLAVAGNFETEMVLRLADKILKPAPPFTAVRAAVEEPDRIAKRRVEQKLEVAAPLFQVGYKLPGGDVSANLLHQPEDEILIEVIAGESSPLFRALYDEGLINQTFAGEAFLCRQSAAVIFSGESKDADQVFTRILAETRRLQREGIPPELFERCKKGVYGRYVSLFNNVEPVASILLNCHFSGVELPKLMECLSAITLEQLQARLNTAYSSEKAALSVVLPQKDEA